MNFLIKYVELSIRERILIQIIIILINMSSRPLGVFIIWGFLNILMQHTTANCCSCTAVADKMKNDVGFGNI